MSDLAFDISSELWLPSVPVSEEFFFVVKQFFMGHGGVFEVRSFDDGVNGAGRLTKSTINAFGHVDIVLGGSSRSVGPGLTLDSNGLSWTGGGTELTSNTPELKHKKPFFTSGISSQSMFASEFGRKGSFFIRVVNGPFWFKYIQEGAEP
jgi:hypothetical protein